MREVPTITREEFYRHLAVFITMLHAAVVARMQKDFPDNPRMWENITITHSEGGNRFVRVFQNDSQSFIKFFVEKDTGIIFDAKSYKAYNPNNEFGTLMTTDEWEWGGYRAKHKQGKSPLVPRANRR